MRTSLVCAPVATLCLLAAACGSGAAPQRTHVAAHRSTGPTLAANRRLSRQEAAKLLALVPVPPGARRLRSAPASLKVPAMGEPGVTGLADAQQSWRLGMPVSAAASWIAAHRPAGLKPLGYAWASFSYTAGYDYQGPSGPAWGPAQLDVRVAPDGADGSDMRADGLVAWLDPVPFRDTATGPRLRVLTAGHCPASDARVVGVRNPGWRLTRTLLPPARPGRRSAVHLPRPERQAFPAQDAAAPRAGQGARAGGSHRADSGQSSGRLRVRLRGGRRVGRAARVRLPGPARRGPVGPGHRLRRHEQRVHRRSRRPMS
jgi:hypothetical protein